VVEQRFGMPAQPDRAVDEPAAALRLEPGERFPRQDWKVAGNVAQTPRSLNCW
jgi:hypothetical protein